MVSTTIQVRRDTAVSWIAENPVLGAGEMGLEEDTNAFKIGDGVRPWIDLPYIKANSGIGYPNLNKACAEPLFLVVLGNINCLGSSIELPGATPINDHVFDWSASPGSPIDYAFNIADPDRASGYTTGTFVGMRGGGGANIAHTMACELQALLNVDVFIVQISTDEQTRQTDYWTRDGAGGIAIRAQVNAALASAELSGRLSRNVPDVVLYEPSTEEYKFTKSPAPMNGDYDIDSSPYFAEKFARLVFESGTSDPFVEPNYTHWLLVGPSSALPYWNGYFNTLENTNGYVRYVPTEGFPTDESYNERFTGHGLQLAGMEASKAYLQGAIAKLPPKKNFRQGEYIFGFRPAGTQAIAYGDLGTGAPNWHKVVMTSTPGNSTAGIYLGGTPTTDWIRSKPGNKSLVADTGLWATSMTVAWDNSGAVSGVALNHPARRLLRLMQQSEVDGIPYALEVARNEMYYDPTINGSPIPTTMSVYLQDGWSPHDTGQKLWAEVAHNHLSGDSPVSVNLVTVQISAPLFMTAKMCDW